MSMEGIKRQLQLYLLPSDSIQTQVRRKLQNKKVWNILDWSLRVFSSSFEWSYIYNDSEISDRKVERFLTIYWSR